MFEWLGIYVSYLHAKEGRMTTSRGILEREKAFCQFPHFLSMSDQPYLEILIDPTPLYLDVTYHFPRRMNYPVSQGHEVAITRIILSLKNEKVVDTEKMKKIVHLFEFVLNSSTGTTILCLKTKSTQRIFYSKPTASQSSQHRKK